MMFCIPWAAGWDRPALPTTSGYTAMPGVQPEVVYWVAQAAQPAKQQTGLSA